MNKKYVTKFLKMDTKILRNSFNLSRHEHFNKIEKHRETKKGYRNWAGKRETDRHTDIDTETETKL